MDYDELFPGRFLKSGEFKGRDVSLTMAGVRVEELPQDQGGTKGRGIIGFRETKKELVLNRTNGECIKAMFGRNTDDWIGKSVTLYPAPHVDSFTGEKGTAIRVRGSRDIGKDISFELRLPKRRPIPMVLKATGPNRRPEPDPELATDDFGRDPGEEG